LKENNEKSIWTDEATDFYQEVTRNIESIVIILTFSVSPALLEQKGQGLEIAAHFTGNGLLGSLVSTSGL
jgi:hypothetical protein